MKYNTTCRIFSAVLSVVIGCSICPESLQAFAEMSAHTAVSYDESEIIDVMVKLNGDAVLEAPEASGKGMGYIDTDTARNAEKRLLDAQSKAVKHIRKLYPELEIKHRFTLTANGFSCRLPESLISEIESDALIESVTAVKTVCVPEAMSAEGDSLSGISEYCNKTGCTGEGEVIAVIDTEFDVTHDMFAPMSGVDTKLSKEDVSAAELSADIDADKVYISNKVPFAYDYGDDTPYDLTAPEYYHGTHVSGIAAGNCITLPNESELSGAAPDAQLLMMKVYGGSDGNYTASDENIAAAIEDAVKLKADVINLSLGRVFEYVEQLAYYDCIASAVNAGVMICGSVGNRSNDSFGYGKMITVSNVDTGTACEPSTFPQVLSAAAAEVSGGILPFSSYGVDTSLILKPEITGIGGNVRSADYGNRTSLKSGTSMASPYIAGCAALIDQQMKRQGSKLIGNKRTQRIKDVLMNSAVPMLENGIAISPRRQGAGLVSLRNAGDLKVIMTGDSGKSAIELFDGLGDSFSFELDITNISSEDVTFTYSDISLTTDGYKKSDSNDKNYISGQILLISEDDLEDSITVPAGTKITKKVSVKLDKEQLSQIESIFTSGFFAEGFISLKGADNCCDISIPLIGFHGDWCKVPVIDTERYPIMPKVNIGQTEYRTDISFAKAVSIFRDMIKNDGYLLSLDPKKPDDYPVTGNLILDDEHKAMFENLFDGVSYFSPNNDSFGDYFGCYYVPAREAVFTDIDLYDTNGELLYETDNHERNSYTPQLALLPYETYSLPDGRYSGAIDAHIRYGDSADKKQRYPVEIAIDRTAPEVEYEIVKKNGRKLIEITASDNALDGIYIMGMKSGNGTLESTANFNALALTQRTLSYDNYLNSVLPDCDKRIFSNYPASSISGELSAMQNVLKGTLKPKEYYNFCDVIPAEPDENGRFSLTYDITDIADYSICILDRAFNEYDICAEQKVMTDFKTGVWKILGERYDEYYEFRDDGTLGYIPTFEREVYNVSYRMDGDAFYMESANYIAPAEAVVRWIDEDNAVLYWKNSDKNVRFKFMQEGSFDDFVYYTDNELSEISKCYYATVGGVLPDYARAEYNSDDDTVSITISSDTEEGMVVHDVYTVCRETAKGVNRNGEPVDLSKAECFSTEGVWSAFTPEYDGGMMRYFKFDSFENNTAKGVYAYQSDGIEHEFECTFDGDKLIFSFDSFEDSDFPSRTAHMRYIAGNRAELLWDNGYNEELTCDFSTWLISNMGFMTNSKIINDVRKHFINTNNTTPDRMLAENSGKENIVSVKVFKNKDDGTETVAEQYYIDIMTGHGETANGAPVDILNDYPVQIMLGDLNHDGQINAVDASAILTAYAKISTGYDAALDKGMLIAADVNSDGRTDASDASSVLAYYALLSTAYEEIPSLEDFVAQRIF